MSLVNYYKGLAVAGQSELLYIPPLGVDPTKYPVIACHGAGGLATDNEFYDVNNYAFLNSLAEMGLLVISGDLNAAGSDNWGIDTVCSPGGTIDKYASLAVFLGAKAGKVILWGGSMGGLTAQNYAAQNPTKVAGLFAGAPACNLDDIRDNNRLNQQAAINTAWGLAAGSTSGTVALPAHANPFTSANRTAIASGGFPVRFYYSQGDSVVLPATVTAQVAALQALGAPATSFVTSATADHSVVAIGNFDTIGDAGPAMLAVA